MWYVVVFIAGFALAVLIVQWDDIKRSLINKKKRKLYQKLSKGRPKKVVDIRTWDDVWNYREYPFLINGETVCVPDNFWLWWHCNDEYKRLHTVGGEPVGYLKGNIIRSRKCYSGWFHYWGLSLADGPNQMGKMVKVSAIVDVY